MLPCLLLATPRHGLRLSGWRPENMGPTGPVRPFTGDFAGELLYGTLLKFGLAEGRYGGSADDGLILKGAVILNAVKCLPPQNKTLPVEETNCRPFLMSAIDSLPKIRTFIALGRVAHDSLCRSFGMPGSRARFAHGALHQLPEAKVLIDSYHCSRYNQNTGRLDATMFEAVFQKAMESHERRAL